MSPFTPSVPKELMSLVGVVKKGEDLSIVTNNDEDYGETIFIIGDVT